MISTKSYQQFPGKWRLSSYQSLFKHIDIVEPLHTWLIQRTIVNMKLLYPPIDAQIPFYCRSLLITHFNTSISRTTHCTRILYTNIKDNRPPGIIVNFFSRPVRHMILRHAKATVNKSKTGIFVLEDLTKQDRALKKAAKPQMMEAHAQGHSVWFSRGKLYINSQLVQIKQ